MTSARPILFVDADPEFGSRGRSLLTLLGSLDTERYRLHLALPARGPLAEAAAALRVAVHVVDLPTRAPFRTPGLLWQAGDRLRRLARHVGTRVVHANGDVAGFASLLAVRNTRTPVVWHVRDAGIAPVQVRRARSRSAAVIVGSHHAADGAADRAVVQVVPDGVPDRFFDCARECGREARREFEIREDAPLVALVSRLAPSRGLRAFLNALPLLLDGNPDASVWIVGGEPEGVDRRSVEDFAAVLRHHAASLGVLDRVRFVGRRDDVHRLLTAADLLVHPSREPEPFALAVAEAKAVGTPSVVTSVGCLPEMVRDGIDGAVVAADDARVLADRVGTLLADHSLRERWGDAARIDARSRWTAAGHARSLESIYDRVIASAAG